MLLPGFAVHPKLVAATSLGMALNFWRGKQWVLKSFWACAAVAFALARLAPNFASNQGLIGLCIIWSSISERNMASLGALKLFLGSFESLSSLYHVDLFLQALNLPVSFLRN